MQRGVRKPTDTARSAGPVVIPPVCELPPPPVPAGREWSDRELARWDELWSSGPANQWDESSTGVVAALVVVETVVLDGKATAAIYGELRHLSEQLGLTPAARARMNWRFADGE